MTWYARHSSLLRAVALMLMAILFLAGCGDGTASSSESAESEEAKLARDLGFIERTPLPSSAYAIEYEPGLKGTEDYPEIAVIVTNRTARTLAYVEVSLALWDDRGVRIGEAEGYAREIRPGERALVTISLLDGRKPHRWEVRQVAAER